MKQQRRNWLLAVAVGLALALVSWVAAEPAGPRLEAALLRLGPYPTVSVRVVSLTRGDVVFERQPDLSLNPASNMKLVTSAAALARLGPDYRFFTKVLAGHRWDHRGRLSGDLCLQGGGDPVLAAADLRKLASELHRSGLRTALGDLRCDDYRYDAERLGNGWNWDDEPFYYSAQVSALGVNRNVVTATVRPAQPGQPPAVTFEPLPDLLRVRMAAVTAPPDAAGSIRVVRRRAENVVDVTGAIAANSAPITGVRVTMEEPELFAGRLFKKYLAEFGIALKGDVVRKPSPGSAELLAEHQSPPLAEILPSFNLPSDNLIGEMLLKEIGYHGVGKGTSVAGSEVVEQWLKSIRIDAGGVRVNDGSGLSRLDLLTARALSDLLIHAASAPWGPAFRASLPVAGKSGTLGSRMKSTLAEGKVQAKTGTLLHVSALSGYVTTADAEQLVFSVIINQNPGPVSSKRIEDQIAEALAAGVR